MPVFAQCLDLVDDPDLVREYVELHRHVPAAVEAALREIGITSMRIHHLGTRLYMTIETREGFDPTRDYQRYAEAPKPPRGTPACGGTRSLCPARSPASGGRRWSRCTS